MKPTPTLSEVSQALDGYKKRGDVQNAVCDCIEHYAKQVVLRASIHDTWKEKCRIVVQICLSGRTDILSVTHKQMKGELPHSFAKRVINHVFETANEME
jgi:hypothetical protein